MMKDGKILGINWVPEHCANRLPEPFEEIYQEVWEYHMLIGLPSGLEFRQCYLDWGAGPLVFTPRKTYTNAIRLAYDYTGKFGVQRKPGTSFPDGDSTLPEFLVKKLPENPPAKNPVIRVQSLTNSRCTTIPADQAYILRQYTGYGGWEGMTNFWDINFYCFSDKVLAAAHRWMYVTDYINRKGFTSGLGLFVHSPFDEHYGYAMRYFRIGCQHKNMAHSTPRMFDHHYDCPDCGLHEEHDSSG